MKWSFQLALYEAAAADEKIFLIMGDVGAQLFKKFRADFPDRFLNVGVCEQTMVSMSAGMAMVGWKPVVYTITPFLIERAFEQIKLDVDQMKLPVGLVGYSDELAGPTHIELHVYRTMALFRNIRSYWPARKDEVAPALKLALSLQGPWFVCLKPPVG